MSGDLKKRLIFSIGTEVSDITEKRLHNANQFKKFSSKLREGLKQYAENCNADFNLTTFTTKNYDDLNREKIKMWEKYLDDYDEVMYLDFDIIPNTNKNIFEKFNFNSLVTYMTPTPIPRFVQSRFDLEDKESFIKTLDKYHWVIKTKQYKDMMYSQLCQPKNEWMMNTGTFGGNKKVRDELRFSDRLNEVKKVVDEVKQIDDRYFYNNETMLTYMIEKYNVPLENLPTHWHQLILSDTNLKICKTSSLIHVINKDFENVFNFL